MSATERHSRRFEKIPPIRNDGFATKAPGEVVHSWKFAVEIQLVFFDAKIGSKNYTICKTHVSVNDIFPTD